MTCQDALDRMMEAEPAALAGGPTADTALAEHLRECGRCRAVASALAGELTALDAGLGELARPGLRPVEQLPRRATGPGAGVWRWIPLAAAAVLAAVLLVGRSGGPPAGARLSTDPAAGLRSEREAAVAVTVPEDRGAAVMNTANPRITVVWLYERSER